jgi:hypothetical protein
VRIIALDFDGVVHSHMAEWQGETVIPDGPVPGAFEFIEELVDDDRFEVHIFSSRSRSHDGRNAMYLWFQANGLDADVLDQLQFPAEKTPAWVTIDDRAFAFEGKFPTLDWLFDFKPWNRR